MKAKQFTRNYTKHIFLATCMFTIIFSLFAQTAKISYQVKLIDAEDKEVIPFCLVNFMQGDKTVISAMTDIDGVANVDLSEGKYVLSFSYIGYKPKTLNVSVSAKRKFITIELEKTAHQLKEVEVVEYKNQLIDADKVSHTTDYDSKEIKAQPTRDVNSISTTDSHNTSGDLNVRGSRDESTVYLVDGMKVRGSPGIAGKAEVTKSVYTNGLKDDRVKEFTETSNFNDLLTAGEINDFSKWKLWENESSVILHSIADDYGLHTGVRICINVLDQDGNAVIDATVTLSDKWGKIYSTRTDNTGIAECWSDGQSGLTAEISYAGNKSTIPEVKSFDKGINTIFINRTCEVSDTVDLAFVVDATSSMSDEIDYLKSDMLGLIREMRGDKKLVIRIASVFYRDKNDRYQSEYSDFTTNVDEAIDYIKLHGADGGGDIPEMMERGMLDASRLSWSKHARSRIAFLIADAPPHNDEHSKVELQIATKSCVEQGVRIVPVACSESTKPTELLMRNMALLSNGTYLYLTDKSGIGDSHIAPTTDKIDNKKLSHLLISVMKRFTKAVECIQPSVEMPVDTSTDSTRINNSSSVDSTKTDSLMIDQSIHDQIFDHPVDNENKLIIYPNPTAGKISLKSASTISVVYIFDFNGKILRRLDANTKEIHEIDLSEFANGEYIVKIDCGTKMACSKVMVQR